MNISEELIMQIVEKEVKEQVCKLINSKKFENIFRDCVKGEVERVGNIIEVAKDVYKDKEIQKCIIEYVAQLTYGNIVSTLKQENEYDDYDY